MSPDPEPERGEEGRGTERVSNREQMGELLGQYLAWHALHQSEAHETVGHDEYWHTVAAGIMEGMAVAGWVMVPANRSDRIAVYDEMLQWLTQPENLTLMRAYEPELMEQLAEALRGAG